MDSKKTDITPQVATEERQGLLRFREKLSYGVGTFGDQLTTNAVNQAVQPMFNIVLGMNPALVGSALMLGKLVDAFTDPLMGWISDNTRTRFGRRRPYILFGGLLCAFAFPLLWLAPPGWSANALFWYLTASTILIAIFSTIYSVPWTALGLEMTPDYHERTRLMAYRSMMSNLVGMLIIPWLFYWAQLSIFGNPISGMRWISLPIALIVLGGAWACFSGCKERYYKTAKCQSSVPFFESVKASMKNKPFLIVMGITVGQVIGMSAVMGLGTYVSAYYVFGGDVREGARYTGIFMTIQNCVGILAIPFITRLSERFGKRQVLAGSLLCAILGSLAKWVCFTPAVPWLQLLPALIIAPSNAAFWMINGSMRADVTDYDEYRTGVRREGIYGSVGRWVEKMAFAFNVFLAGWILYFTGIDPALGGDQAPDTLFSLRIMFSVYPVLWGCVGLFLLRLYPLSEQRLQDIRKTLEERRGAV
jgi:GPH family glycoside/pentoside/hexuronide:cation symporter